MDFPDHVPRPLHESCRDKLMRRIVGIQRTAQRKRGTAYLRAPKTFLDLVLRRQPPPDEE
jgi:hypothetical protein